jgi:hypothetical protein
MTITQTSTVHRSVPWCVTLRRAWRIVGGSVGFDGPGIGLFEHDEHVMIVT